MSVISIDSSQYPQTWDEYIGQEQAKRQLKVAIASAKKRSAPVSHTLLASPTPGIGKTALALLVATEADVRILPVSGKMNMNEARIALSRLDDHDILFIDEAHRLVQGGKGNAEWLLHLLQDGVLMGPRGVEEQPKVTIIGATTDVEKLPATIVSRFPIRPTFIPYTVEEAGNIAMDMAASIFPRGYPHPSLEEYDAIAKASGCNPRTIRGLLTNLRDLAVADMSSVRSNGHYDLSEPLRWMGLTPDGLTSDACTYLSTLVQSFSGQAGANALRESIGRPIEDAEALLLQRGFIARTRQGRVITKAGIDRANTLIDQEVAA